MREITVDGARVEVGRRAFLHNVEEHCTYQQDKYVSGVVNTEHGLVKAYCSEGFPFGERYMRLWLYAHNGATYERYQHGKGAITVAAVLRAARQFARAVAKAEELTAMKPNPALAHDACELLADSEGEDEFLLSEALDCARKYLSQ